MPHAAERPPARSGPGLSISARYATGQLLALAIVLLVTLPMLPVIALLVLAIRIRDRAASRRRDHGGGAVTVAGSLTPHVVS